MHEQWMSFDRQHVPTETAMFKHGEGAHATLNHRRAHLCWRKGALPMHCRPTWNGERVCATNGIQRRRDNQRKTDEATCLKRKPHGPQSNCRRSKCASTKHLSTHMMPTIIRWTQLARITHKNCDGTHLHGNPLRTVSIRHQRNKRCVTIPQMPHRRHAHNNRSGQRTRTSKAISYLW